MHFYNAQIVVLPFEHFPVGWQNKLNVLHLTSTTKNYIALVFFYNAQTVILLYEQFPVEIQFCVGFRTYSWVSYLLTINALQISNHWSICSWFTNVSVMNVLFLQSLPASFYCRSRSSFKGRFVLSQTMNHRLITAQQQFTSVLHKAHTSGILWRRECRRGIWSLWK